MPRLKTWRELEPGGTVEPAGADRQRTAGWRTGVKPVVELDRCVNCLLCWLHCPDSAVVVHGTVFDGFDYDFCKGCEICAAVCPVDAIRMEREE